jgi:hypothetical protein
MEPVKARIIRSLSAYMNFRKVQQEFVAVNLQHQP